MGPTVVDGINRGDGIVVGENLIEPGGSEIFADVLLRAAVGVGDAALRACGGEKFGSIGDGPESQQGLNARYCRGT